MSPVAHHIKLPPPTLSWVLGFLWATDGKGMQKICPPLLALPTTTKPHPLYTKKTLIITPEDLMTQLLRWSSAQVWTLKGVCHLRDM